MKYANIAFTISAVLFAIFIVKFDYIAAEWKCLIYSIMAYFFIIFVVAFIRDGLPALLQFGERLPIVGVLLKNIQYRQRFFLYFGGFSSFLFVVFYFWVAWYYQSKWFYVLGLYNLTLSIMRGYLSREEHRLRLFVSEDKMQEEGARITRTSAILLFLINAMTTIMGLRIVFKDDTFQYHFIILYALAIYVFTRLSFIIVNIIKIKPHNYGIWRIVQFINLATALVSMFTFQTALLNNYEKERAIREHFNAMTGLLVFSINLGIAIWLFVKAKQMVQAQNDD